MMPKIDGNSTLQRTNLDFSLSTDGKCGRRLLGFDNKPRKKRVV
jgi:hypothetical protein